MALSVAVAKSFPRFLIPEEEEQEEGAGGGSRRRRNKEKVISSSVLREYTMAAIICFV
jgi:hypothetical protein